MPGRHTLLVLQPSIEVAENISDSLVALRVNKR